ncbi:MAG: ATP-binding cassette domain-containing protein [archaeon]
MPIVKVESLTKFFGSLKALDSVSFEIEKGEIFGLLGPNGAGKTTLLSILSTLRKPSDGKVLVNNFNPVTQSDDVRKSIGIVFQDPSLDIDLTAFENLDFHARLYGLSKELRSKRIPEVLGVVELTDKANLLVKTFSGGMKRRLEIARGLMHYPKVLFLDEPTLGLDPATRRKIWEFIQKLNEKENVTIILTTHYMEEADFLCGRIAIIDLGKIIALNTPNNLKKTLGEDVLTINSNNNKKLVELIKKNYGKIKLESANSRIFLTLSNAEKLIPRLVSLAEKNSLTIDSIELRKPTLEDVFLHFTGKHIREEVVDGKEQFKQQLKQRMGVR